MMKKNQITADNELFSWQKFSWAAFLFHIWYTNDAYIQLMRNEDFTRQIWADSPNPDNLDVPNIVDTIVGFLQGYGCRIAHTPQLARAIQEAFRETVPYLQALYQFEITKVDFNHSIEVNRRRKTVKEVVQHLYSRYDQIKHIGPTTTAKLLHILQPRLFVMWDEDIANYYHTCDPQINQTPKGYYAFLAKIQQFAKIVNQEFQKAVSNTQQTPANYLSDKLEIEPPKTLAKYLDEYNWVIITKGINLPPCWYPE